MKPLNLGKHWGGQRTFSLKIIEMRYNVRQQTELPKKFVFPFWVLDYDFLGGPEYRLGGQRKWKTRDVNTVHLYPPNTTFTERQNPDLPCADCGWMIFDGDFDSELRSFTDEYGYASFRDPDNTIGKLLKKAAKYGNQREEIGYWPAVMTFANIMEHLQKATHEKDEFWHISKNPISHKEGLINEAELFISQNLNQHITIEDIAGHLKISKSTLGHYYRDLTGRTPIQALREARVAEAKSLLIQGLKLKNIAQATGFCDEYHLAKTFKNITGTTPGKFRSAVFEQANQST